MDIPSTDPRAAAVVCAIQIGDTDELLRLLSSSPGLGGVTITCRSQNGYEEGRSLLHIATDWPGNFPSVGLTIRTLVSDGADPNAVFRGRHRETPLHWAASCDDVAAIDALLDHGADREAPGSVIDGGTPLANAVAFGQWKGARRLIERGVEANLWQAAGLGLLERTEFLCAGPLGPEFDALTNAFWCACHGGQQRTAQFLLGQGAALNWIGHDRLTPLDAALRMGATALADWLRAQGAKSAKAI